MSSWSARVVPRDTVPQKLKLNTHKTLQQLLRQFTHHTTSGTFRGTTTARQQDQWIPRVGSPWIVGGCESPVSNRLRYCIRRLSHLSSPVLSIRICSLPVLTPYSTGAHFPSNSHYVDNHSSVVHQFYRFDTSLIDLLYFLAE